MHSLTAVRSTPAKWPGIPEIWLIGTTVAAAPVWWALGLNLLIYHFAAAIAFMMLVVRAASLNQRLAIPGVAWWLLVVAAVYAFSIALNAADHDFMRILAAANNVSYWLMGFMLVAVFAARFRLEQIARGLRVFAALGVANLLIAAAALMIASRGVESLTLPTPLSRLTEFLGDTALVDYSVHMRLITSDWFSETATPRFNLYSPYPTAAGAFLMVSVPMLTAWAALTGRLYSLAFGLLFLGHLGALFMTLARMAVVALVVSTLLVFVLQKRNAWIWGAAAVCFLGLSAPWLEQSVSAVIEAREGSSQSRMGLYIDSIAAIDDIEWIVGHGIRTYSEVHRMPMGSHSTYVSLLYRSGAIGLAAFLFFQCSVLIRWYRLKQYARPRRETFILWRAFGIVFLSMSCWMLTEDIDVPQLLAFMYFSIVGAHEGFRRSLLAKASDASPGGRKWVPSAARTQEGLSMSDKHHRKNGS